MKKITFLLVLLCVSFLNFAQNQVATLQHGGEMSAFYGKDALSNAHAAATAGDTIVLSSGNFEGCVLSKAVIIHGAGCAGDAVAHIEPTIIRSQISLKMINDTYPLVIEGVFCYKVKILSGSSRNIRFNKCFIDEFESAGTSFKLTDSQFDNCIIKSLRYYGAGLAFSNCVVKFTTYNQTDMYNMNTFYNSIMLFNSQLNIKNSVVYNSIIATVDNNSIENLTFYNCIGVKTGNTSLFDGQLNSTNMEVDGYDGVFETFNGTVTYDNSYQLKEEIANTFIGNDGTEVGIYGGMMPYTTRLSYMIIKQCNVAGKTTQDNKLSVEIELNIDE